MKTNFIALVFITISVIAQAQVKLRSDNFFMVGYNSYTPLTLGQGESSPNNGAWAIEHWDNGLNIWKPWPSYNWGNYKLFIDDWSGCVGIGRRPYYMLDVEGDIATYGSYLVSSDERLKTNIAPLSDCLSKLNKLNGKSYYKAFPQKPTVKFDNIKDSVKYKTILYQSATRAKTNNSLQFGLLAQEVKTVFPELVREDSSGYMTVDYTGLIPVIIEALKEQKSTIDAQSNKIKELEKRLSSLEEKPSQSTLKSAKVQPTENLNSSATNAFLYQNAPNSFNDKTDIRYYLPHEVQKAFLYIFNMQGTMIKTINIVNRGEGSITLNSSEFKAGMYIYSLSADGNEVDIKRMILTE